jgi:hypothetical protein
MRQHLEDDVSIRGPKSAMAERRQAERMSRVVRKIKTAFERISRVLGVLQAR